MTRFDHFFKKAPAGILQRGLDYYNDNAIVKCIQDGNHWKAKVQGNYGDYNVQIQLNKDDKPIGYYCNCPYDEDICKHIIATLYYIDNELNSCDTQTTTNENSSEGNTKFDFNAIIDLLPEKEVRDILKTVTKSNISLQNQLELEYGKKSDTIEIAKYQNKLRQILYGFLDDDDYLDESDSYGLSLAVYSLLEDAKTYQNKEFYFEAFSIFAATFMEIADFMERVDDSNGEISGIMVDCIENISEIHEINSNNKLTREIFNWLKNEIESDRYQYFGQEELEDLLISISNQEDDINSVIEVADRKLKKLEKLENNKQVWSSEYEFTKLIRHKYHLLLKIHKTDIAQQLIEDYIYIKDFREIKLNQLLGKKDFDAAIDLLYQGIEYENNKGHYGIKFHWQKELLNVYILQKDTSNIQALSLKLFKENPSYLEFYKHYKKTIPSSDWVLKRDNLIQFLTTKTKYGWTNQVSSNLAEFLIAEKMWPELLAEVKKSERIEDLMLYLKYLQDEFPAEIISLLKKGIFFHAKNTGRNIYQDLVKYLKVLAKINGGKEVAVQIKTDLLDTYKNRPAMKSEFNALKF